MRRVFERILAVAFASPIALALFAWMLVMLIASLGVTIAIPVGLWQAAQNAIDAGGVTSADVGLFFMSAFFMLLVVAVTYGITWVSAKAAVGMGLVVAEDARGAAATREVMTERAEAKQTTAGCSR